MATVREQIEGGLGVPPKIMCGRIIPEARYDMAWKRSCGWPVEGPQEGKCPCEEWLQRDDLVEAKRSRNLRDIAELVGLEDAKSLQRCARELHLQLKSDDRGSRASMYTILEECIEIAARHGLESYTEATTTGWPLWIYRLTDVPSDEPIYASHHKIATPVYCF